MLLVLRSFDPDRFSGISFLVLEFFLYIKFVLFAYPLFLFSLFCSLSFLCFHWLFSFMNNISYYSGFSLSLSLSWPIYGLCCLLISANDSILRSHPSIPSNSASPTHQKIFKWARSITPNSHKGIKPTPLCESRSVLWDYLNTAPPHHQKRKMKKRKKEREREPHMHIQKILLNAKMGYLNTQTKGCDKFDSTFWVGFL